MQANHLKTLKILLDTVGNTYTATAGAIGTTCIATRQYPPLSVILWSLALVGIPTGLKTLRACLSAGPKQDSEADTEVGASAPTASDTQAAT